MMSKLLVKDSNSIPVSPALAMIFGVTKSMILQQVHYWLDVNAEAGRNFKDGAYWTYNSIKDWHEKNFKFWSYDTVKKTFAELEKEGFLITSNYNAKKYDKTKWYTINYKALEALGILIGEKSTKVEVEKSPRAKVKNHQPIPEISPETSPYISKNPIPSSDVKTDMIGLDTELDNTKSAKEELLDRLSQYANREDNKKTDMSRCDNTPSQSVNEQEKSSNDTFDSLDAREDTEELNAKQKLQSLNCDCNYSKTEEIVNSEIVKNVKEKIGYDRLIEEEVAEKAVVDSFAKIMIDTLKDNSSKKSFVQDANGNIVSTKTLQEIFSKANFEHIKYTITCFLTKSKPIKKSNLISYIKTAIYRNFFTYELSLANEECVANPQPVEQATATAPVKQYQAPVRKNRFCNFEQAEWDFDKIKKLEEEYIENELKNYQPSERAKAQLAEALARSGRS